MAGVTAEIGLTGVREILRDTKGKVSRKYGDMSEFIVTTTRHMADFRTMITPYAKYFYPADNHCSGDCFLSDVVEPSRKDLNTAIDRAVSIMEGDDIVNNKVSFAIEEVLALKKSVDMILDLIDEIDIYSENMLIISTKYGSEGKALARISNEMGAMSRVVSGVDARFRTYLAKLAESREEFNTVRDRIDVIGENYLTTMKLDISLKFGEMVRELDTVSGQVNGILSSSSELESSMKGFVNNIQMEDIIRQKMERILYYLDERECLDSSNDFGPAILHVVLEQLADLRGDVSRQDGEIRGYCERLSSLLNEIQSRIDLNDGDAAGGQEEKRMDTVYHQIEKLKNEYIGYMEEIISDKKRLLNLSMSIIDVLNEFEKLFCDISDIIRRFEALNMITRIELARHTTLSQKLGGALTSVMILPEKMKRVLDESLSLYRGIRKNIEEAATRYSGNFVLQEEVLAGCIDSMKKVSVKLYESQKYYWDISNEIGRCCRRVLQFNDENCRNIGLLETLEALRDIMAIVHAHYESEYGDYRLDVAAERLRLRKAVDSGESSLLAELYRDLGIATTKENVILF